MTDTKRQASRLILIDSEGRVLLFCHLRKSGETFWAPPGGGLEEGETFEQAALREASEELGTTQLRLTLLWEELTDFVYLESSVRQQERFFLAEGDFSNIMSGVQQVHQQEGILETKWWTLNDINASREPVFPAGLFGELKKWLESKPVSRGS